MPIKKQPERFTRKVDMGKPQFTCRTTNAPSKCRPTAPIAPPAPMTIRFFISVEPLFSTLDPFIPHFMQRLIGFCESRHFRHPDPLRMVDTGMPTEVVGGKTSHGIIQHISRPE